MSEKIDNSHLNTHTHTHRERSLVTIVPKQLRPDRGSEVAGLPPEAWKREATAGRRFFVLAIEQRG